MKKLKVIKNHKATIHINYTDNRSKKLQNMECFNYLDNPVTKDARFTRKIKSRIAVQKQHST
jgi:hypothetical protein